MENTATAMAAAATVGRNSKDSMVSKDSKGSKDSNGSKDSKDSKGSMDSKDSKGSKDSKDSNANDPNTYDLETIEKEIIEETEVEKKRWQKIASLMILVEKKGLWKKSGAPSYSAWVGELAKRARCHVSVLWKALRAGKYAAELANRGIVNSADDIAAAAESLELAEKIERKADLPEEEKKAIIQKVISGQVKRGDLRGIWKSSRPHDPSKRSNHPGPAALVAAKKKLESDSETHNPNITQHQITAQEIVAAIESKWNLVFATEIGRLWASKTEVPVVTPTARHARRIDLAILGSGGVTGIEIKVSKGDLESDQKAIDYSIAVDRLFFAVPDDLVDIAKNVLPASVGIIAVNTDKNVRIVRQAVERDAIARSDPESILATMRVIYSILRKPFSQNPQNRE